MVLDDVIDKASFIKSILSVCNVIHNEKGALLLGTFETEATACLP
jgi:hypothetical protein